MDNIVTIRTFTYPHELSVVRGRLESEGIECFVQDEMMAQVNPLYSNAIGGVKLQVRQSDATRAVEILREADYLKDEDFQPSVFYLKLNTATSKIPVLKSLPLEIRLALIGTAIISVILIAFYFITLPSKQERLVGNNWCVDKVVCLGKEYSPNSIKFVRFKGIQVCDESINFRENGTVVLPGYNSYEVWGHWKLVESSLMIDRAETFGFLYNGVYDVSFSGNELILKSAETVLNCHAQIIKDSFH